MLQISLAALGVAKLQRFIPRSVMVGSVNALRILIFSAQLEHLIHVPWPVYPLVAADINVSTVADMGELPTSLPGLFIPDVPLTLETLRIIGPYALIGQTMINVKESGARTRLSTLLAGVFLPVLILLLGDIVGIIPMAALVAIMIMVSVDTIDWHSVHPRTLKLMPSPRPLSCWSRSSPRLQRAISPSGSCWALSLR